MATKRAAAAPKPEPRKQADARRANRNAPAKSTPDSPVLEDAPEKPVANVEADATDFAAAMDLLPLEGRFLLGWVLTVCRAMCDSNKTINYSSRRLRLYAKLLHDRLKDHIPGAPQENGVRTLLERLTSIDDSHDCYENIPEDFLAITAPFFRSDEPRYKSIRQLAEAIHGCVLTEALHVQIGTSLSSDAHLPDPFEKVLRKLDSIEPAAVDSVESKLYALVESRRKVYMSCSSSRVDSDKKGYLKDMVSVEDARQLTDIRDSIINYVYHALKEARTAAMADGVNDSSAPAPANVKQDKPVSGPVHESGFENPSVLMSLRYIFTKMGLAYDETQRRRFKREYKDAIFARPNTRGSYYLNLDHPDFKSRRFKPIQKQN